MKDVLRGLALVMLLSLAARAQESSPTASPMEWDSAALARPEIELGADQSGGMQSFLESYSFDNPEEIPATSPTAPPVEEPGNPGIWITLAAVLTLAFALLGRRLYYDNVFGRRYLFSTPEVPARLGASYSGGLGAAVEIEPAGKGVD